MVPVDRQSQGRAEPLAHAATGLMLKKL
jgi:hypothetical protein